MICVVQVGYICAVCVRACVCVHIYIDIHSAVHVVHFTTVRSTELHLPNVLFPRTESAVIVSGETTK